MKMFAGPDMLVRLLLGGMPVGRMVDGMGVGCDLTPC